MFRINSELKYFEIYTPVTKKLYLVETNLTMIDLKIIFPLYHFLKIEYKIIIFDKEYTIFSENQLNFVKKNFYKTIYLFIKKYACNL